MEQNVGSIAAHSETQFLPGSFVYPVNDENYRAYAKKKGGGHPQWALILVLRTLFLVRNRVRRLVANIFFISMPRSSGVMNRSYEHVIQITPDIGSTSRVAL